MKVFQSIKSKISRIDLKLTGQSQTGILLLLIALTIDEIQGFDQTQFFAGASFILISFCVVMSKDYAARNRILLSLIFIGTASFLLKVSNTQRWALLLGISFAMCHRVWQVQRLQDVIRRLILISNFYFLAILIFKIMSHFSNYALQFLSFGYDNALHFSLYKSFRVTSWYPFLDVDKWSSDFSLFRSYPSAQAALFSLLSEIFVGATDDPIRSLSAYFSLVILVFGLMIFLIYRILQIQSRERSQVKIRYFISAVTICYAFVGIFLTNGFPPYQFGLMILLIWLSTVKVNEKSHSNIYLLGGLCFFMILNSPALLFCIILPCVVLVTRELVALFHERSISLLVARSTYLVGMAIITLAVNSELSSKFGWRQILAGGGVQPPNVFISGSLSAIVCAVLWMERKTIYNSALLQVLLSSILSFVILAVTTIFFTGSIQYYAIKQWYLCLVFISIVVFRFAFEKDTEVIFHRLGKLMVGLAIVIPATYASVYAGGFMGTFPKAIAQLSNQVTWAQSPVNSDLHLKLSLGFSGNTVPQCVVFRAQDYDSDLNSRWANSLLRTESMSEDCFKGYWNSNQLSDTELVERLSKINENFIIFIDRPIDLKNGVTLPTNVDLMSVNP